MVFNNHTFCGNGRACLILKQLISISFQKLIQTTYSIKTTKITLSVRNTLPLFHRMSFC